MDSASIPQPANRAAHRIPASLLLGAVLFWPPISESAQTPNCGDDDRACAARALDNHPVARVAYWKSALAKPLEQRVGTAPAALIEYLRLDNIKEGIAHRPRAPAPDAQFSADLSLAFERLPARVTALLGGKLAGIYLVDDLGGSGFTSVLLDRDGKAVAGVVVLDASVLATRSANVWATWKENTPFRHEAALRLTARIEADTDDTRANAIQYILLHELGHVVSIGAKFHPPWTVAAAKQPDPRGYDFFNLSWRILRKSDSYVSRFDADFPGRSQVTYYFGARLDATAMPTVYADLARTNFPTLYAATSPGDDFAESFANYVHTVLMGKPFAIRIERSGELLRTLGPCWKEERCAAKAAILARLLGG